VVALNLARLPVERDVTYDGGVVVKMRRAQPHEKLWASQKASDWEGAVKHGTDRVRELGLTKVPSQAPLNVQVGGYILRYALYLWSVLVFEWDVQYPAEWSDELPLEMTQGRGCGTPIPLTDTMWVSAWLLVGSEDGGGQLERFLSAAEGTSPTEASEGNALRPSPNGSGVMVSNIATDADPATCPVHEANPA
jgi:hypothetical protein